MFGNCKSNLVTSPFLLRYDSSRPIFMKTDWYAGGMGYILIQPDDYPDSLATIKHLTATCDTFHLMVHDSALYSLDLVLIFLTSAIITHLLVKLRVDGGLLLHVANIFGFTLLLDM